MSLLRSFSLLRGVVRPSVVGSHLLSPVVFHQKAVVRGFASKKVRRVPVYRFLFLSFRDLSLTLTD